MESQEGELDREKPKSSRQQGDMRKQIRGIKEDALGPEARAAQQRELERIDRLEKQQCSDLPALAKKLDVSDKSSPVPNLEHSQHLPTTEVIYLS